MDGLESPDFALESPDGTRLIYLGYVRSVKNELCVLQPMYPELLEKRDPLVLSDADERHRLDRARQKGAS